MTKTTRRRVAILVAATLSLGGAVGGAYWYRQHQAAAKMAEYREQGMKLYGETQYSAALLPLSKYIGRNQLDAPALLAYGRSRALTIEPDNRHVVEGIGILRRYQEISPGDTDAQKLLLELYTKAGWSNEAIALADTILVKSPTDPDALRARYIALGRSQKWAESLAAVKEYLDVRPTDLPAHWRVLQLIHETKAPRESAVEHVKTSVERIGKDDPRALLLQAQLATFLNDRAAALANVNAAIDGALATPPRSGFELKADFVDLAADILDRLGEHKASQSLVERAADSNSTDPDLANTLAERLWLSGKSDSLLRRTQSLDPAAKSSSPKILGLRALVLLQSEKKEEAKTLLDGLAKRDDDALAAAWVMALRAAYLTPDATPLSRQKDYQAALIRALARQDPVSAAIFYHLLAGVSWDLGESELAISHWGQTNEILPQWNEPSQHLVMALMQVGRPADAMKIAAKSLDRAPTTGNAVQYVDTWAAVLRTGANADSAGSLIEKVNAFKAEMSDDVRLLPALATAQSVAGKLDDARKTIQAGLSNPATPPAVLSALADVASFASLNLENDADAALSRAGSPATPDRALARSLKLANTGQKEDALAELERAAASRSKEGEKVAVEWQLAVARFRDETVDPKATVAFKDLAEKNPEALKVQMAVLASRSAWTDRQLITTAIEKVRQLSGDDAITWRVAKARLLLQENGDIKPGDRESAEAVVLLSEVVRVAPRLLPPRLLLANALQTVNNKTGAFDQLSAAAEIDPQSPVIAMKLVDLLESQGRADEARAAARRVMGSTRLTLSLRVKLADTLARLGDVNSAAEVLSQSGPASAARPNTPEQEAMASATLARLQVRQGRTEEAIKLFDELLANDKADKSIAVDAADLYASMGDVARGRATLEKAAPSMSKVTAASAMASFEERFGDKEKALSLLKEVVAANPNAASTHTQLAGFLLRAGKYDDAARAIAAGLTAVPGDPALSVLGRATEALAAVKNRRGLQTLITYVTRDPKNPAAIATMDALRKGSYALSDPTTLDALREVVKKYPSFLPAHAMVIQGYLDNGRPRDAADAAQFCVAAVPSDPEAAALAAAAFLAAGDPQGTIGVARRWRELTPDSPLSADLAVASAELALKNPRAAMRQLKVYVKDGSVPAPVMLLMTQATLADGGDADAWAKASMLWKAQPAIRTRLLAAIIDASRGTTASSARDKALALLDRIEKELAGTETEHFLLAQAFARLGNEHSGDVAYVRAGEIIKSLEKDGKLPTPARVLLAEIARHQGDFAAAESQYRAALAQDPNSAIVRNNLADLLVRRDGARSDAKSAREAAELARAAVSADPTVGTFHDTLGRALEAIGQADAALASYETALRLQGDTVETLVAYGSLLKQANRSRDLSSVMLRLESLVPSTGTVAPAQNGQSSGQPLDPETTRRLNALRGLTSSVR